MRQAITLTHSYILTTYLIYQLEKALGTIPGTEQYYAYRARLASECTVQAVLNILEICIVDNLHDDLSKFQLTSTGLNLL